MKKRIIKKRKKASNPRKKVLGKERYRNQKPSRSIESLRNTLTIKKISAPSHKKANPPRLTISTNFPSRNTTVIQSDITPRTDSPSKNIIPNTRSKSETTPRSNPRRRRLINGRTRSRSISTRYSGDRKKPVFSAEFLKKLKEELPN